MRAVVVLVCVCGGRVGFEGGGDAAAPGAAGVARVLGEIRSWGWGIGGREGKGREGRTDEDATRWGGEDVACALGDGGHGSWCCESRVF